MSGPADIPDISPDHAGAITGDGELVTVLPLLLGFRPVNSLILITHNDSTQTVSEIIRYGLPAPEELPALVAQVRDTLAARKVVTVSVVVIGGGLPTQFGPLPSWGLIHALTVQLRDAGVTVRHPVWAASTNEAAPWRCYRTCRCGGAIPALDTSPVAAALIMAGATISDRRELLAATLAADPGDQLERRAAMLDSVLRSPTATELAGEAGFHLVQEAITEAVADPGLPLLSDTRIVHLACALANPAIRDRCLAAALSNTQDDAGSSAVSEHAEATERLWTVLTRAVPGPQRAEPAFLLAVHAFLDGRGALAAIALDIAVDANPQHAGARSLHLALHAGITPEQLRHVIQDAVTEPFED